MTKIDFDTGERGHTLVVGTTREGMASLWNNTPRKNAAGDIERSDLNQHAYEHHWQRPDGSVYAVDSSD